MPDLENKGLQEIRAEIDKVDWLRVELKQK